MSENIERTLGRLEAKVDVLLEHHAHSLTTQAEIDQRVTKLERWQAGLVGGGAVMGFLIALVARIVR